LISIARRYYSSRKINSHHVVSRNRVENLGWIGMTISR